MPERRTGLYDEILRRIRRRLSCNNEAIEVLFAIISLASYVRRRIASPGTPLGFRPRSQMGDTARSNDRCNGETLGVARLLGSLQLSALLGRAIASGQTFILC